MSNNFCRYDIVTEKGSVGFYIDAEKAQQGFKQYCKDKDDGYNKKVLLYGIERGTRKQTLLAQY